MFPFICPLLYLYCTMKTAKSKGFKEQYQFTKPDICVKIQSIEYRKDKHNVFSKKIKL